MDTLLSVYHSDGLDEACVLDTIAAQKYVCSTTEEPHPVRIPRESRAKSAYRTKTGTKEICTPKILLRGLDDLLTQDGDVGGGAIERARR